MMNSSKDAEKLNKIVTTLLIIAGVFTLIAGIYFPINATFVPNIVRVVLAILLIIDAVCYFIVGWSVSKKIKRIFWPTVILLIINILGFIFDDFGALTFGALTILASFYNLVILVLIILKFKR